MIKNLNLSFFAFLSIIFSSAEAQNTFHKKYLQGTLVAQLLQTDNSGNIYIAGYSNDANVTVTKLDSSGRLIWDKEIGILSLREFPVDMIMLSNQSLVIAAVSDQGGGSNYRQGLVIGMDTAGTILFNELIGDTSNTYYTPSNIISDSSGFTIAFDYFQGTPSYHGTCMMKFNSTGIPYHERLISQSNGSIFRKDDHSYILTAYTSLLSVHLNSDFENPYGVVGYFPNTTSGIYTINKIVRSNNGELYMIGSDDWIGGFIGHINSYYQCDRRNGIYLNASSELLLLDMKQFPGGDWMLLGHLGIQSGTTGGFCMIHTDSLFHPIASSIVDDSLAFEQFSGFKMEITADYKFLFSASRLDALGYYGERTEVIRTDTNFTGICKATDTLFYSDYDSIYNSYVFSVTVTPNNSLFQNTMLPVNDLTPAYGPCYDLSVEIAPVEKVNEIAVYPNPAGDVISLKGSESGEIIKIYNELGVIVFSGEITENVINISNFQKGVYCYRIIKQEGIDSGKFIKE